MAAELKREYGILPQLKVGKGGQFDVLVDDRLIYSKADTQRFPEPGEVNTLLRPQPGV